MHDEMLRPPINSTVLKGAADTAILQALEASPSIALLELHHPHFGRKYLESVRDHFSVLQEMLSTLRTYTDRPYGWVAQPAGKAKSACM